MGDVDQVGKAQILHLPAIPPVTGVSPLLIKTVFGGLEMKIFRDHARIQIDGGVFIRAGHTKGAVIHDVVEIDADAKAVRHLHHVQKIRLGAIAGAVGATLDFGTQIKTVEAVVAHGQPSGAFGWRRKPQGGVASLCQLRHFFRKIGP